MVKNGGIGVGITSSLALLGASFAFVMFEILKVENFNFDMCKMETLLEDSC
jgi:hypothetical protein